MDAQRLEKACRTERNLIRLDHRAETFTITALIFSNMLTVVSLSVFLGL